MPNSSKLEVDSGTLQRRLQLALDAASMGAWEWDPFTGVSIWDECMFSLTGIPSAIGENAASALFAIMPAEDLAQVQESVNKLISGEDETQRIDFRIVRPDTGKLHWLTSQAGIQNIDGHAKLIGVMYDVTDRLEAQRQVETATKAKDDFLAMVSHELRAPLFPISLYLELMTRKIDDKETIQSGLDVIKRQTQQIKRLVDDLLDLSRITAGRILLHHERVDALAVLSEAVECSMHLISKHHHQLVHDSPKDPVFVDGDRHRLVQVMTNLIQNAAKYTPDGGCITLTVRGDGDRAMFRVSDTGPGIPDNLKTTLFDIFFQVSRDQSRAEGGMGIGLALVKKLVELHGGNVGITDNEPQGSIFTVVLPRTARKTDQS